MVGLAIRESLRHRTRTDAELPSRKPVILTAMSATLSLELCTIHFTPKIYKEKTEGKGTESKIRGLNLVLYFSDRKWHVKLTF